MNGEEDPVRDYREEKPASNAVFQWLVPAQSYSSDNRYSESASMSLAVRWEVFP